MCILIRYEIPCCINRVKHHLQHHCFPQNRTPFYPKTCLSSQLGQAGSEQDTLPLHSSAHTDVQREYTTNTPPTKGAPNAARGNSATREKSNKYAQHDPCTPLPPPQLPFGCTCLATSRRSVVLCSLSYLVFGMSLSPSDVPFACSLSLPSPYKYITDYVSVMRTHTYTNGSKEERTHIHTHTQPH